jgi:hypothetical protein
LAEDRQNSKPKSENSVFYSKNAYFDRIFTVPSAATPAPDPLELPNRDFILRPIPFVPELHFFRINSTFILAASCPHHPYKIIRDNQLYQKY